MENILRKIDAMISLKPPGLQVDSVRLKLELDRLTVLVGPNASGKTTVLQTIGFILSSLLSPPDSATGLALTRTLRPEGNIPSIMSGKILVNSKFFNSLFYTPYILSLPGQLNIIDKFIGILGLDPKMKNRLKSEIEKDVMKWIHTIAGAESKIESEKGILSSRMKIFLALRMLATTVLGEDIQIALLDPLRGIKLVEERDIENISYGILRYLWGVEHKNIWFNYVVNSFKGVIDKSIILGIRHSGVLLFKKKYGSVFPNWISSVTVFHPGFIYSIGVFESLYKYYAYRGIPREKEAIRILQRYIPWVEGYELLGRKLSLRSRDGRRISVYSLSDGHRIAVFLTLLYALSSGRSVFLIDTPEAFVHPDGLSLVADLITYLVKEGNQVVVATQSIEFLTKLLRSSVKLGVAENTLVEKVHLSNMGVIEPVGAWRGEIGLNSIDEWGLDLRR